MVYRRYTNFAMESQSIYFDGDPDFGKRVTALVPRRGDLLGPMILEIVLPYVRRTDGSVAQYVNSLGHALIEEISIEIGEQEIDKQTGEWMEVWSLLTTPPGQELGYNNMIGRVDGLNQPPSMLPPQTCSVGNYQYGAVKLYIPLQFWFNKNPGLYLPLLAMQYHPIRINLKLRGLGDLLVGGTQATCGGVQPLPAKIVDMRVWGDYVYLDTEERRRFTANMHEYLIEQIQYTPRVSVPENVNMQQIRLEFNHPLREIIWVMQRDVMQNTHEWFNFGSTSVQETGLSRDMLQDAVLQVDGFDRFDARDAGYFRLVQPYQYHTNIPTKSFVYLYSFALRPEEMQPSGSLNASRIDNMVLQLNWRPDSGAPQTIPDPNNPSRQTINPEYVPTRGRANTRVYAKNHNVLRVVNGFAGLLFRI